MTKRKVGRPPVADKRVQITVTLPLDDYEVLKRFAEATGKPVATFIREIVTGNLPQIEKMTDTLNGFRNGTIDNADAIAIELINEQVKKSKDLKEHLFSGEK